jgi:hypothetical protein
MGRIEHLRPGDVLDRKETCGDDEDVLAFGNHRQNIGLLSGKKWFCVSTSITTCLSRRPVRVQTMSSPSGLCPSSRGAARERWSGHMNPTVTDLLTDGFHGSPDRRVVDYHQGNGPQQTILERKVL